MSDSTFDDLNNELDVMAIRMLRLMKDYIEVKLTLEDFIKVGSLHLAKSRYIMGNKSVSILQLPSEDSSEFLASCRVVHSKEPGDVDSLSFELSKVSLEDIANSGCEVKTRASKNDEDKSDPESDKKPLIIPDPLKWFGVLVPQNMRQAQWNFNKAIEYSIQCANIQLEMDRLRSAYETKLKDKSHHKTTLPEKQL